MGTTCRMVNREHVYDEKAIGVINVKELKSRMGNMLDKRNKAPFMLNEIPFGSLYSVEKPFSKHLPFSLWIYKKKNCDANILNIKWDHSARTIYIIYVSPIQSSLIQLPPPHMQSPIMSPVLACYAS